MRLLQLSNTTRGLGTAFLFHPFHDSEDCLRRFRFIRTIAIKLLETLPQFRLFLLLPAANEVANHIARAGKSSGFAARIEPALLLFRQRNVQRVGHDHKLTGCLILSRFANAMEMDIDFFCAEGYGKHHASGKQT